jgi:hypothetical protein
MTITEKSSPQATAGKGRTGERVGGEWVDGPDCPARVGVEPATIRPWLVSALRPRLGIAPFTRHPCARKEIATRYVARDWLSDWQCGCHAAIPRISFGRSALSSPPVNTSTWTCMSSGILFFQRFKFCRDSPMAAAAFASLPHFFTRSECFIVLPIVAYTGLTVKHQRHYVP